MKSVDSHKFEKAKQRVIKLKQFYEHLFMFILISIGLATLNFYQNSWSNPWFLWAVISWGIGVGFHALFAFERNPIFGKKWEEKKINELLEKEEQRDRWE